MELFISTEYVHFWFLDETQETGPGRSLLGDLIPKSVLNPKTPNPNPTWVKPTIVKFLKFVQRVEPSFNDTFILYITYVIIL